MRTPVATDICGAERGSSDITDSTKRTQRGRARYVRIDKTKPPSGPKAQRSKGRKSEPRSIFWRLNSEQGVRCRRLRHGPRLLVSMRAATYDEPVVSPGRFAMIPQPPPGQGPIDPRGAFPPPRGGRGAPPQGPPGWVPPSQMPPMPPQGPPMMMMPPPYFMP